MAELTIDGITLKFKDSAFTGDQWESVASWVLNTDVSEIEENAKTATEKAAEAKLSANAAATSSILSESYAVGGTGTRDGEDTDNARYYAGLTEAFVAALNAAAIDGRGHLVFISPDGSTRDLGDVTGEDGSSIQSITRTAGNGAPGTTDTYTVTLTDGSKTQFQVYNGKDGIGTGDMTAAVYDPQGKKQDVFQYVSVQISTHNEDPNAHAAIRQAASEAAAAASNAQTTADGKADKASIVTATLAANGWADGVYILSVNGVTATSNQEILPAVGITAEQLEALQAANIQDGGQAANNITLIAFGDVPTIDIPIRVIKRGD